MARSHAQPEEEPADRKNWPPMWRPVLLGYKIRGREKGGIRIGD
jgi:hypothetical protein